MEQRTDRIRFPGAHGVELVGRLHKPPREPLGYALFAHCFTCSKDLKAAVRISSALSERGWAVLRFDFTGLGESAGDFADTNFTSNLEDLLAAAAWLREHHEAPRLLVGHSLGGSAVIAAAPHLPEVTAVATIAAPCDPTHVRDLIEARAPDLRERGEATVSLGGRSFKVRAQLLDDLEEQRQRDRLANLKRALLVFHSPFDQVVGVDNARRLFEAAKHPKSFVSLDRADHLLSEPADAEFVASVLASWAARYVDDRPELEPRPVRGEHGVVEAVAGASGFRNEIVTGAHGLLADEPESVGGTDAGPAPYDLLLAALGACTTMTLRMYADRKGWPLQGIKVRLNHKKVPSDECPECRTEGLKVDRIEKVIEVIGPLDDDQRKRLLEIADRCPVNRTLKSDPLIVGRLAGT